jgi:ParB/RepB/Spo0J family partition protein
MPDELCKLIRLDLIDDPRIALRSAHVESVEYCELKASMGSRGLDNSILLRPKPGGRFERVDGGHRVAAARELAWVSIAAIIREMTDDEALAAMFTNANQIPTTTIEYAKHILRIQKSQPDITMPRLAAICGKSTRWVRQQLSLNRLDARLSPMVDRGELKMLNVYELARLPKHRQFEQLENCLVMQTAEFRAYIAEIVRNLMVASKDRKAEARLAITKFKPHRYWRSHAELSQELKTNHAAASLLAGEQPKTMLEAFKLAIDWATHVDPETLALRKADFLKK